MSYTSLGQFPVFSSVTSTYLPNKSQWKQLWAATVSAEKHPKKYRGEKKDLEKPEEAGQGASE